MRSFIHMKLEQEVRNRTRLKKGSGEGRESGPYASFSWLTRDSRPESEAEELVLEPNE